MFSPAKGGIRIHAVSSLVKSLAGLDVYLAHFARAGDVLVIDEPEMNAHPDAQVLITELLALLVNHGVRVVLTTHSPYIVDHIRNLMVAATPGEAEKEKAEGYFRLRNRGAFLRPESVSAYLFGTEGVTNIIERDKPRIRWETFGQTSEYVANLYSDLLALKQE